MRILLLAAALIACPATCAIAKAKGNSTSSFIGCKSEQQLKKVISSSGKLASDGCRSIRIVPVKTDSGRLCVIDLSGSGKGVLSTLRNTALTEKWWVRCDVLGR